MVVKKNEPFITWVLGIFTLITFGLVSLSLTNNLRSIETDAALLQEIRLVQKDISDIRSDNASEEKQDRTLAKHWKLHGWTRDEINELRSKAGLQPDKWPDFE